MKIACTLFAVMLLVFNSMAQRIETDRPSKTESATTVSEGTIQTETAVGTEIMWDNDGLVFDYNYLVPSTLFRIALGNKVELRVKNSLRSRRIRTDQTILAQSLSLDDLEAGFKWQITSKENSKFNLALMSHAIIPTSVKNPKKTYGAINRLLFAHELTDRIGLGYHVGHVFNSASENEVSYSLFLSYGIFDSFRTYIEVYGHVFENDALTTTNMDAGFTFLLKKNMQLDYSFGFGLDNRMNFQKVGISMRFPG